jgi:putative ABC transport system permease protein
MVAAFGGRHVARAPCRGAGELMSWLSALRHRITGRLSHTPVDGLPEEIAFHLELETDRQRGRGFNTPAAQAEALARFGDPGSVLRSARAAGEPAWLDTALHDLRAAWRGLTKHPAFSVLAIATLALGIATTTVAFTVLDTVLLRSLPYRQADRLVMLEDHVADGSAIPSSFPNFADRRNQSRSFNGVAAEMFPYNSTVNAGGDNVRVAVMGVSRNFFGTLGAPLARGRELNANEHLPGAPAAVMVSYEFWQSQMNGRPELGTIRLSDETVPVVGVAARGFKFFEDADVYISNERFAGTCRSCSNYRVFGRLVPGVSRAAAQAELATIQAGLQQTYGHDERTAKVQLVPMREYLVAGFRALLAVVFAAAGLVLAIACINLISAQLARGLARSRELAVRSALGASYRRLVSQLLLESLLLAMAAAACGGGLAVTVIRAVRVAGKGLLPRLQELRIDLTMFGFVVLAALITGLVIGVLPAIRLARTQPGTLLGSARGSAQSVRLGAWRALVAGETGLAIILVAGSSLLVRTMHNIVTADTGFGSAGLLTAALPSVDSLVLGRLPSLAEDLRAVPGVVDVAWTNSLPLQWGNNSGPVRRPTDPVDHDFPARAGFRLVSSNFFTVLRQPILQGRGFMAADIPGSPAVVVVSDGLARTLWPGESPIGKTLFTTYLGDHPLTVIGVAGEASSWSQPRGAQPEIYVARAQFPFAGESQAIAMIRTNLNPHALFVPLRTRFHAVLPEDPVRLDTIDDRILRSAADRRFATLALTAFGLVALLLAAVGVYGTMSYLVTSRTRELGVRLALGAAPARLLRQVLTDAAGMAAIGIVPGIVAGLLLTRLLQATLYGVGHTDPIAYLLGAAVLLATAVGAALIPAWRSSRVDPLVAMAAD